MFEAAGPKERIFSISGLWSKVSLGLVKERSSFWQQNNAVKKASTQRKETSKRNSRVIDPNEWVQEPIAHDHEEVKPIHKSLSMGQLDIADSEVTSQALPISEATVAFETRASGRKSVDIFLHSAATEETKESVKVVQEPVKVVQEPVKVGQEPV